MTPNVVIGDEIIERRALKRMEELSAPQTLMILPVIVAFFCCLGIAAACCSEFYSSGVGFHAAFPVKSDGTSLADDMSSLRYPIILSLLLIDVMLLATPNQLKVWLNRLLGGVGVGAILLLLFGVGAFMFSATFLTLGSSDGQGFAGHLVGLALATASAAMFSLSFLASHAMMGKLFTAVPVIVTGLTERATISRGKALIADIESRRFRMASHSSKFEEMEKPDALRTKTATEIGVIVGGAISNAYDLKESRAVRGDVELGPDDVSGVPDVPLAPLEKRYADLSRYTFDYFYDLLKQKES